MNDFWSDPEINTSGDYVKFGDIGDTITGTITAIRKHTFDDGKIVPQIELDVAGEPRTLTAGQVRLKAALAEQRPGVGDVLTVTLTQIESRAGGKSLKHFDVTVGPVATPAAPVAAPAAPPAAAPAATPPPEGMSEAQMAALKAAGLL